ncbi:MAG: HIT family protein [Clostridia bacterium]
MCIFCKIINGEIPSKKIYENDYVYAFLDIAKDTVGHTLVIPKKHCENILDCPEQYLCETIKAVKLISNHYIDDCGYEGVDIFNANNACAEQTVFHLHFHIIPRKVGDNLKAWNFIDKFDMNLDEICQKLKLY